MRRRVIHVALSSRRGSGAQRARMRTGTGGGIGPETEGLLAKGAGGGMILLAEVVAENVDGKIRHLATGAGDK